MADTEACEGCRAADLPAVQLSSPAGLKYFTLFSVASFLRDYRTGFVIFLTSPHFSCIQPEEEKIEAE